MDWGDDNDDDDANDFLTAEQDNAVAPDFSVKDSILFVIDARAHMCKPPAGGGPSCFAQSLQCVLACMKDRVLGGERDLVGVLLFGTREAKLPSQSQPFPHLYLLQELEEPSADSMRHISLVANAAAANDGSSGGAKAEDAYGGSAAIDFGQMDAGATLDMSNVLWVTSILFAHSKNVKNMRRRVYLMTNDDSPCGADKGAHARALTRSRDLQDANIWIEPFFFAPPPPKGPAFDLSERSFWRELISGVRENYKPPKLVEEKNDAQATAAAENGTTTASTTANVEFTGEEIVKTVGGSIVEDKSDAWLRNCVAHTGEDLLERVRRTAHRKKVQWTSELTVGEGMSLSFVMVGMVHPAPRPTAKKLEAKTNDEIESNTAFMDAADGSALEKSEIYKTYNFGGKWVYFHPTELGGFGKEEDLGKDGLLLLGFKDKEKLKLHHNLKPAKFIEPTDKKPGSILAMSSLIHSMHHKGKIGIAKMCKGKTGQPQMVALLPQLLELEEAPAEVTSSSSSEGESRRVKLPCGLHLIPLPFAEDIRSISKPPPLEEDAFTPQQLECARGLVSALRLPPERNPIGGCINPATAVHYNTLEQLALNVPGSEQPSIIDGTKPDLKWLEQSQPQLDAFKDAFELHDVDVDGGASKRQKTGPKVEKLATPTSLAEWIAAHLQGRISTLTNPALKDFCKSRGLPVGGKKDDLLARIADHLEEEMARDPSLAGGGGGGETSAAAAAAPKPDDDF